MRKTKKTVKVELEFHGPAQLQQMSPQSFAGGVVEPRLDGQIGFEVWREIVDEDGLWNPVVGEDTIAGGFQISLVGTSAGFRELGKYLLALAEFDTAPDPSYHEHHELTSVDGRTRLHIIARKKPGGGSVGPDDL